MDFWQRNNDTFDGESEKLVQSYNYLCFVINCLPELTLFQLVDIEITV